MPGQRENAKVRQMRQYGIRCHLKDCRMDFGLDQKYDKYKKDDKKDNMEMLR